jgi:hypothetical protein
MALSPKARAAASSELSYTGAAQSYDVPLRNSSPLAKDVARVAKQVADDWHRENPNAKRPAMVQVTDALMKNAADKLGLEHGVPQLGNHTLAKPTLASLFEPAKPGERPDPLASWNRARNASFNGKPAVSVQPEDQAFYSTEADPKGTAYAVGSLDQDRLPGFGAGPFKQLQDALECVGHEGEAVWRIVPGQEPSVIDVWVGAREIRGERFVPGWAVNQAREECHVIMAKAAAPKKNFGATAATASAPTRPPASPPARPQRQAAPVTEEDFKPSDNDPQDDDVSGAEDDAPEQEAPAAPAVPAKTAKKRPTGSAPAVQEGETLDDLKRRAGAPGNGQQVFVSVGKTINIGDYESVRIDVGICRPVEDGQTREEVTNEVIDEVFATINNLKTDVLAAVESGGF